MENYPLIDKFLILHIDHVCLLYSLVFHVNAIFFGINIIVLTVTPFFVLKEFCQARDDEEGKFKVSTVSYIWII